MSEWISVKDRLPEYTKGMGFIVVIVAYWSHIRKIYIVDTAYLNEDGLYDNCDDKISMDDGYWELTHWMPLPAPPETDETK